MAKHTKHQEQEELEQHLQHPDDGSAVTGTQDPSPEAAILAAAAAAAAAAAGTSKDISGDGGAFKNSATMQDNHKDHSVTQIMEREDAQAKRQAKPAILAAASTSSSDQQQEEQPLKVAAVEGNHQHHPVIKIMERNDEQAKKNARPSVVAAALGDEQQQQQQQLKMAAVDQKHQHRPVTNIVEVGYEQVKESAALPATPIVAGAVYPEEIKTMFQSKEDNAVKIGLGLVQPDHQLGKIFSVAGSVGVSGAEEAAMLKDAKQQIVFPGMTSSKGHQAEAAAGDDGSDANTAAAAAAESARVDVLLTEEDPVIPGAYAAGASNQEPNRVDPLRFSLVGRNSTHDREALAALAIGLSDSDSESGSLSGALSGEHQPASNGTNLALDADEETGNGVGTNEEGLVEAFLVLDESRRQASKDRNDSDGDDDNGSIVEAVMAKKSGGIKELMHNRKLQAIMGVLVLIAIVGPVAATMLARRNSNSDEGTATAPPFSKMATMSPTAEVTEIVTTRPLEDLLPEFTMLSMKDPNSPQLKALEWIVEHPAYDVMAEWRKLQLFALATFYFNFHGDKWPIEKRHGWLSYDLEQHECNSWGDYRLCESEAGGKYAVQELRLEDMDLGQIPDEDVWQGKWVLPPELTLLSSLESILIVNAGMISKNISDLIPPQLTNLGSLGNLHFQHNAIEGTIPTEIGLLPALTRMFFANISLTGTIPTEVGHLRNITSFYLHDNWLTGTIPSEIGLFTNMLACILYENQLTGTLPVEVSSWTEATTLSVSGNSLNGTFPTEIGLMTKLDQLALTGNYFTGTIPTEVGVLDRIEYFSVEENQFTGQLPSEIGLLTVMTGLHMWDNLLMGLLPSFEISQLQKLKSLDVDTNQFSGSLPAGVWELGDTLDRVWLASNKFNGTIPTEVASMQRLTKMYLSGNQLSGSLPSEMGLIRSLKILDLSSNPFLEGTVPVQLGDLRYLEQLLLSDTGLEGGIPEKLCRNTTAVWLNCSRIECPRGCICNCDEAPA